VSRINIETIKAAFTSPYWLIASLCGAFFTFFALNRGGVVVFIETGFFFLLINILTGEYQLKKIPVCYWITIAICAYLLITTVVFNPDFSRYSYRQMANLVRMLCVIFAIHCLSQKRYISWLTVLFFAVLLGAVCWQLAAYYIFQMPYGSFSNPHIIASFTMLAFPIIFYLVWITPGWYKLIFISIGILDVDFLLRSGSRPAIVAIALAGLFAIIFLIKSRRKWICLLVASALFILSYFTEYPTGVVSSIVELIAKLPSEDRTLIWSALWDMLKENSLLPWIFGNGIGSFRPVYPKYAHPLEITAIFPHLHILEVLYESGLIGVILVFGGIIFLIISAVRSVNKIPDKRVAALFKCILIMFLSWSIHCGLTVPIYSKYSQYSLAFIIGPLLVLLENSKSPKNRKSKI